MKDRRGEFGKRGEAIAARYLKRKGHLVLKRNFRTRFGEIDIITRRADVLCFVEVKTRHRDGYFSAVDSITTGKEERIRRTAEFFLLGYRGHYEELRFDAVLVLFRDKKHYEIEHILNIF